jgi:septum site-determining protein MinC
MPITLKQNKKGTFLDLSSEDFSSQNLLKEFAVFTSDASKFLAGSSVSLIVPENINETKNSFSIIDEMKKELNLNNISIKSILSSDETPILRAQEAPALLQEEIVSVDQDQSREIIDTSYLPETLYIEANLRSGQLVRYPGNVFVLGDVNPSAEIIASGDIIIWGSLRGVVHAGANGDRNSKIIAMDFATGQIRIADEMLSLDKNKLRELARPQAKSFAFGLIASKNSSEDSGSTKIPLVAKIRNNEIIIARYF